MRALAWSGTSAVAVGDAGEVLTTQDGIVWERLDPFTDRSLCAVVWDGSEFLAAGKATAMYRSKNGFDWTEEPVPFGVDVACLGYHEGTVFAATEAGDVWTRVGGFGPWNRVRAGDGVRLNAFARTAGRFIFAGENGMLLASRWGVEWEVLPVETDANLRAIAVADQTVVVGESGTILVSDDLCSWEMRPPAPPADVNDIAWNGTHYVAVSSRGIYRSADGEDWAQMASWFYVNSVAWAGNKFVAVGADGRLLVSSSGTDWSSRPSGTTADLWVVHWDGEKIFAGGDDGLILESEDGQVWESGSLNAPGAVFGIAGDRSTGVVAVTNLGYVARTDDGESWSSAAYFGCCLHDIAFEQGQYITAGSEYVRLSSDGQNWQGVRVPHFALRGVGADDDHIYVVGTNGVILSSDNGQNWEFEETGLDDPGGDLFVAHFELNSVLATPGGVFVGGDNGVVLRRVRQ